jgi:hypothetical protein
MKQIIRLRVIRDDLKIAHVILAVISRLTVLISTCSINLWKISHVGNRDDVNRRFLRQHYYFQFSTFNLFCQL